MYQEYTIREDTKSYGVADILNEIMECVDILKSLGISGMEKKKYKVEIACRMTSSFGTCSHFRGNDIDYKIRISKLALDSCSPEKIHNTIMHEVIHSVDGCDGHKNKWKSVADIVNKSGYRFTEISRLGHDDGFSEAKASKPHYLIVCNKCNSKWNRYKKTVVVTACQDGSAKCGCGSHSFTVNFIG